MPPVSVKPRSSLATSVTCLGVISTARYSPGKRPTEQSLERLSLGLVEHSEALPGRPIHLRLLASARRDPHDLAARPFREPTPDREQGGRADEPGAEPASRQLELVLRLLREAFRWVGIDVEEREDGAHDRALVPAQFLLEEHENI